MESRIYVGTEAGIVTLQSSDGRNWNTESEALQSWEVSTLAVDPTNPNRVLAGTRGDGVWLSEDCGKSWRKPCYGKPGPGKVRSLAIDPKDPRRVYAGCEPIDIFVSDDFGASWERLSSVWEVPFVATVTYPVATVEPHVRDIAIDPNDPNTIYAALQVGYILKSMDDGRSWTLLNNDLDCDVHTIVIDPTNTSRITVATGGGDSRKGHVKGRALYASADGGASWGPSAMEFEQEYSVPLVMSPSDPKVMFSALAHGNPNQWRKNERGADSLLIRTRDGGASWESVGRGAGALGRQYPEAIAIDRADSSRVYAGFRSGDFIASADGGDTWTEVDVKTPSVTSARIADF